MRHELFTVAVFALVAVSLPATSQVTFYQPLTFNGCSSFVADFNGDGKPDLLCGLGTINTLYLGNGDGTFTVGSAVLGPVLAVADFNGDGKPDLLAQGTGTLLVALGNGDGTFQAPISTASGAALLAVGAADLNGDGKADVVGVFNNSLYVYIGNGDGTFKTAVTYNLGQTIGDAQLPLLLGDFNKDGNLDVVVVAVQEIVFLGNGDGTFHATPNASSGVANATDAVAGDFNGDGNLDLAISTGSPVNIYLLPGNGDGTFQSPVTLFSFSTNIAFPPGTLPLAAADVNGDGKLDLIFSPDPTIGQIYLGNGDGTFSGANSYGVSLPVAFFIEPPFAGGLAVADFNLDGKLDVAVDDGILLGNGDGTFQGVPLGVSTHGAAPPQQISGKFEKNGAIDVAQINGSQLLILHNNGAGVLTLLNTYTLQQQETAVAIVTADFNGDGNLDLAVVQQNSSASWGYSVLLGNGDGSFQAPVFYPQNVLSNPAAGSIQIYAADLNNDHKADLAVTGVGNQSLAVLLGNGDGTFAAAAYYYDGGGGAAALIADFNGDGNLDVAIATNTATGFLYGNGDGTFQVLTLPASLNFFEAAFTADFNNDGKPDLLSFGNQVALGNGDGTFKLLPAFPINLLVLGIADFNGDGKLDLLEEDCCNKNLPIAYGVAIGNGDGTFAPLINDPSIWYIATSNDLFVDINGDGRVDIVFAWGSASSLLNGLGVLFNTTSDFTISATVPSPSPLTPGSSAISTVSSMANFGFNTAVALSCSGLPTGATCAFNPASIANASGTSELTIGTTSAIAPGTYMVTVYGTAGSTVNGAAVALVIQAEPDFSMTTASGSSTSQTVNAGETATFSLSLAGSGTFSGAVDLSCAVTPAATLGPTCSLSSSSVQISGAAQSVTVKVGTTAPSATAMLSPIGHPPELLPLGWTLLCTTMVVGFCGLALVGRKRTPLLVAPVVVLAMLTWVACGGTSSSSSHSSSGTPAGTYTATVTATSGSLNHTMALKVTVQ
jgi:hypothetical protein